MQMLRRSFVNRPLIASINAPLLFVGSHSSSRAHEICDTWNIRLTVAFIQSPTGLPYLSRYLHTGAQRAEPDPPRPDHSSKPEAPPQKQRRSSREYSKHSPRPDHGLEPKGPRQKGRWSSPEHWKHVSPSDLLIKRLRNVGEGIGGIASESRVSARMVASSWNARLAVLTHQYVLRTDEEMMKTSVSEFLGDRQLWQARLDHPRFEGVSEDDLAHWAWILEAADTDTKVERLLSSERHKPAFILMVILRTDEKFLKGSSLVKLYDYIKKVHIKKQHPVAREQRLPAKSLDGRLNMPPFQFMVLIYRLLHHAHETFPSSVVAIAGLVVDYLQTIPQTIPKKSNRQTGYSRRCLVFNYAMGRVQQGPVSNMVHAWRAQRILLEYSASLQRPLIINKNGYRSIRATLLGLKKSPAEQMTAVRHAKTWPPYIRELDGTDETRDQQDYLSRSVKAGILKRSEGYADILGDDGLDILGGGGPSNPVTIQTRSSPLGRWTEQYRSLQVFTDWAARVKATRNSHEAWQMFHHPPMPGLKPNFQVYAEMFAKLFAKEVEPTSSILAGDAKETFSPYQANLTEFERERLRPCSPEELYERMLQDGNRPIKNCLCLLIIHAPNLERATRFLNDSPLHKDVVKDLTTSFTPEYVNLVRVPVQVFKSYLAFLCIHQGRRRWVPNSDMEAIRQRPEVLRPYGNLNRAITLLTARFGVRRKAAAGPWHIVMRTLAHNKLVLRPFVSQAEDNVKALGMMNQLFHAYRSCQRLDPIPFDCLGRCIIKVLRRPLPNLEHSIDASELVHLAFTTLKATFDELITPVKTPGTDETGQPTNSNASSAHHLPELHHELSAAHIQTYMEVLAKMDDVVEAVRVAEWLLGSWDTAGVLREARDPGHKQWGMMRMAFMCFRAMVAGKVPRETLDGMQRRFEELRAEKGGTWAWPSAGDVEAYRTYMREKEEELSRPPT